MLVGPPPADLTLDVGPGIGAAVRERASRLAGVVADLPVVSGVDRCGPDLRRRRRLRAGAAPSPGLSTASRRCSTINRSDTIDRRRAGWVMLGSPFQVRRSRRRLSFAEPGGFRPGLRPALRWAGKGAAQPAEAPHQIASAVSSSRSGCRFHSPPVVQRPLQTQVPENRSNRSHQGGRRHQ